MKTKISLSKQILSIFLCMVMLLSYVPISAFAASPSEAQTIPANRDGKYSYYENLTVYYKHNNYLYKAVFSNIKTLTKVGLATNNGKTLFMLAGGRGGIYLQRSAGKYGTDDARVSDLPKTPDDSLYLYMAANLPYATDKNKPVVTITCVAVNEPTWTWNGTSSATAKFTSTDNGATLTVNASISSSTQAATSCVDKEKITYTAKATANGTEYTDTKTVDGAAGSHGLTYVASGNVITESCYNGCGHNETATLGYATGSGTYAYTGSEIKPLQVTYTDGWQGETFDISYSVNITNVGTAMGIITVAETGVFAEQTFTITKAAMTEISVNGYSGVYDRNAHSISVTNVPSDATVTYSTSENGTYTTTNPAYTEKGTYEVWYRIENENYETVSGSASVVISQATNDWTTAPSIAGWTYGETAKNPSAAAQFGTVKVEYRLASGTDNDYTTTVPTEAGSYLVHFSVEGNENYTSLTEVVELEIAQVKLTVTADDKSKTYGESDPELTYQITEGLLVGSDTLEDISICRADGEDADSYVITVSQTDGANPNYDITFVNGSFTIKQKEIGISWGATEFLPYTGELIVPQANATGLLNDDVCTLTVSVVETTDGAGIIPGRWTAKVTALSNDNYCLPESGDLVSVKYGIVKGYIDAPVVSGIDETIKGKADGRISGLTIEMEYATEYTADDDKYTKVTDANMTFAAGTYYVRYQAAGYYNASPFKEVVIKEGRLLSVTTPQTQTGYTIATADNELVWNGSTTLTFVLKDGYSKTGAFAVKVNGTPVALDSNDQYVITNAQENIVIAVEGVADITSPTAEIKIEEDSWNSFWNDLTFGLFFKEPQEVTITADDNGSGVNTIQYYLAGGELSETEVEQITEWEDYNDTFKIDPNNRYVVYARVTDNAGNILYINSDGIVLDNIAPTLEGIENGKTYYGDLTVIKSDEQFYDIKTVTLDGEPMGFEEVTYDHIPADNAEHIVVVEDYAGNKTTYVVTVMKNYTVTYKADGVAVDTQSVGHGKDATAAEIPAKDGYVGKWDRNNENITADTEINAVYTKLADVVPDDFKPEDKTDLEDTKKQLEEMLEDDGYTEDDKKDIQEAIDDIDDALEVIGNVENVEDLIDKIPDTVTKDDEAAIKAADDAYNALTDEEKALVDPDAKKALDDAKAALAELNKPADTDSPQTGDNSNLWLWFALLFISGAGIFGITVYDRKRKAKR